MLPCQIGSLRIMSQEGTECHTALVHLGMYTTPQARTLSVECVKLDEMVQQGSEKGPREDAVTLDPADLGAPDLMLMGNGWSIPVHRCSHMCHTPCPYWIVPTLLVSKFQGRAPAVVQTLFVACHKTLSTPQTKGAKYAYAARRHLMHPEAFQYMSTCTLKQPRVLKGQLNLTVCVGPIE